MCDKDVTDSMDGQETNEEMRTSERVTLRQRPQAVILRTRYTQRLGDLDLRPFDYKMTISRVALAKHNKCTKFQLLV